MEPEQRGTGTAGKKKKKKKKKKKTLSVKCRSINAGLKRGAKNQIK